MILALDYEAYTEHLQVSITQPGYRDEDEILIPIDQFTNFLIELEEKKLSEMDIESGSIDICEDLLSEDLTDEIVEYIYAKNLLPYRPQLILN